MSVGTQKNRNFLSAAQTFQMTSWLLDNRERFEAKKFTAVELATMAEKLLGCKVTDHNIRGAAKTAGLKLPKGGYRQASRRAASKDVEGDIAILAGLIQDLCAALGVGICDEHRDRIDAIRAKAQQ